MPGTEPGDSPHDAHRDDVSGLDGDVPGLDGEVLGLDNVRLDLPLAGVGSRGLAFTIDLLLLGLLVILWLIVTFGVLSSMLDAGWTAALAFLGAFVVQWGYFAIAEITMDGRTPGKAALGLRTVSHLGGKPSVGALVLRNLVRSVDLLVGLPVMAIDRRQRRLGDILASTLVVHHRAREPEPSIGRLPASWGAREVAVVEAFLRRAPRMETARAEELAARLLAWIERREPELTAESAPLGTSLERLYSLLRVEVA